MLFTGIIGRASRRFCQNFTFSGGRADRRSGVQWFTRLPAGTDGRGVQRVGQGKRCACSTAALRATEAQRAEETTADGEGIASSLQRCCTWSQPSAVLHDERPHRTCTCSSSSLRSVLAAPQLSSALPLSPSRVSCTAVRRRWRGLAQSLPIPRP